MKKLFITLSIVICANLYAQNVIYIGTKSYKSTKTFSFLKNGEYHGYSNFDTTCGLTFAKSSQGGLLMISAFSEGYFNERIVGTILIYLKNGEVLTLVKRLHSDSADKSTSSIYKITNMQLNKLKQINIASLRYSIQGTYGKKSFTCENRFNNSYQPNVYDESTFDIPKALVELF